MSQYATSTYYTDTFGGTEIPLNERDKYLKLASEKIDTLTFNRIVKHGLDNLTSYQKSHIQDATCYQAEYIYENGAENQEIQSYSVLDININLDSEKTVERRNNVSIIAYDYLKKTGLMCQSMR